MTAADREPGPPPAERSVSIGTWNMDHWKRTLPGCPCRAENCRHVRTFGGNPGTQLDWLYATEELARRCTRLRVDHSVIGTLSDHAPLIADFRIPPLDGGMIVDPDSFVEELRVRAGCKCARIAEELIA